MAHKVVHVSMYVAISGQIGTSLHQRGHIMASYGDCDSQIEIRLAAELPDIDGRFHDYQYSDDESDIWDYDLPRLLIEL